MKIINGGVCAAKGFSANGVHCGIRKNRTKRDLALIYSEVPATAAAVYTTNLVKGAPLTVTKNHIADGYAQAVICNSGNANTCNANGIEIAEQMSELLAKEMGIKASDVVVASTGVIGQPLDIEPIKAGIPALVSGLSKDGTDAAAEGIMTAAKLDLMGLERAENLIEYEDSQNGGMLRGIIGNIIGMGMPGEMMRVLGLVPERIME
ncbi:MAG: bifunctional ornithine acetyltransferase/N-acetylglutamate synthase [Clostridia bacterium]|nr:bifunctional ornithine acetyltransferase/N-acetylglutamate synthase [Clostridia bacterium]